MATVISEGKDKWVVHMSSPDKSCVTVEVNMDPETARRIAERETERIAALNPDRNDLDPHTIGSAVMSVLSVFASGAKF